MGKKEFSTWRNAQKQKMFIEFSAIYREKHLKIFPHF